MNDKFFDIKKEKQDRILNAAFQVFACNGYRKSSTDEIVKAAGISKGLLFHYFGTKAGLYEFLCSYAVKYLGMEFSSMLSGDTTDFFLLKKQIEAVRYQVSQSFPYLSLFLQVMMQDTTGMDDALLSSIKEIQASYDKLLEDTLAVADFSACASYLNPSDLKQLADYIIKGVLSENYSGNKEPSASFTYERTISLLNMLADLSRRE